MSGCDYKFDPDIQTVEWLSGHGIPPPDYVLDPTCLERNTREELGWTHPFPRQHKTAHRGVYMFYDECLSGQKPIAVYVGRTNFLGIRLNQHWSCHDSGFNGDAYFEASWGDMADRLTGLLLCAVWHIDSKALQVSQEALMVDALQPMCNRDMREY